MRAFIRLFIAFWVLVSAVLVLRVGVEHFPEGGGSQWQTKLEEINRRNEERTQEIHRFVEDIEREVARIASSSD